MAYPNSAAVIAFAATIGITITGYDFAGDLAEAIQDFESRTNRRGFQTGGTVTYTGDGPDWRSEATWWIPDFSAITQVAYNGVALADGTDYLLHRWREGDDTTPYVAVEFLICPGDKRRRYTVTGTRGYGAIPSDVELAIIKKALAAYLGAPLDGQGGQISREKIGAREVEYDLTAGRDAITRLIAPYESCVARYTRWT